MVKPVMAEKNITKEDDATLEISSDLEYEESLKLSDYVDESLKGTYGLLDSRENRTHCADHLVNAATGNHIYRYEDIRVDGSFPISFSRFYNSRDNYNGALGMNWHHNFEYKLYDIGE